MLSEQFKIFIFDLDGVIYLGDQLLPGVAETLHRLRMKGSAIRFLTNDPRPTRLELSERLKKMGLESHIDEIIASGWATATYLSQNKIQSAYVIGSPELRYEISQQGVEVADRRDFEAVVVGCDENVSYQHIRRAAELIHGGSKFIATNADPTFPTPDGPCPATGALLEAIQAVTGKQAVVIGKPSPFSINLAIEGLDDKSSSVIIGDDPSTDILGAHQAGISGILISKKGVPYSSHDFRMPDAILQDLSGLFDPHIRISKWKVPSFQWPDCVEAGVAAVILEHDQVLLVKRTDNGLWGLPSGRIQPGETIKEAVKRELLEETGLQIDVVRLIGVYSDPASQIFSYPMGKRIHFITSCFQCEVVGGELSADGVEITDAAFFKTDNLPKDLLTMHPQWLSDALAKKESPFVR